MNLKLNRPWLKAKGAKFKAIRTEVDGIKFDSIMESDFYRYLLTLPDSGKIECHPNVILLPTIKWKLDFLVKGQWYDVKGFETPEFKLKAKLWALFGPGDLVIVKKAPGLSVPWSFKVIKSEKFTLVEK